MTVRPQPEIVDIHGFRRRGWEFDDAGETYYIQETNGPRVVFRKRSDETWQPLNADVAQAILVAFDAVQAS